jgi:hypothetical protein
MELPLPVLIAAAFLGLGLVLGVIMTLDLLSLLKEIGALESPTDLDHFKRVVKRQMYAALMTIVLAGCAAIALTVGFIQGSVEWTHTYPILALAGVYIVTGIWTKSVEARAKQIPTGNDEIQIERDRVVKVWMSRAFPDW